MKRALSLFAFVLLSAVTIPLSAFAAPMSSQPQGLFITPPRQYLNATAGKVISNTFTVGNLNDTPMKVSFSVDQFSLTDYTYDYKFSTPKEDWIKISKTQVDITPKTSQKITYAINIPKNASPGGHYFSIFASATLETGKRIRTAVVVYVTVDGDLKKSSEIISDNLPTIIFGNPIQFNMAIKNTGNTHFFIYVSHTLSGWFFNQKGSDVAHILLPQTVRSIDTTVTLPILPGIYKLAYGYRNEEGEIRTKEKYITYVPIWFVVTLVGLIWLSVMLLRRKRRFASSH